MDNTPLAQTCVTNVAALGGFLEGISYLNQDHRSDFAEAFIVTASNDSEFLTDIYSRFTHLPGFTLKLDDSFQGGFRQLEQDISALLLANPHAINEQVAKDMRSYLSFKVVDRLDDISDLSEFLEPKRYFGTHDETDGSMIFYLLRSLEICFVLYFFSGKSNL